jgi:hypothetical protein
MRSSPFSNRLNAIPWAGSWHGHEGWTKFFQTLGENADDITLKTEPFAAQGDNVVTVGRYQPRSNRRASGSVSARALVDHSRWHGGEVPGITNTATEAPARLA